MIAVEQVVYSAAVEGTVQGLRQPPGRDPSDRARALRDWYLTLSSNDQRMLTEVVRDAAHSAVFGVLSVLDGVRAIDEPPHVELRLLAMNPDGGEVVLNDPTLEDLHDRFNGLVHPPSEGWTPRHD